MVVHTCNLNPQEVEAGGLQVQGQTGLRSKPIVRSSETLSQTKQTEGNIKIMNGWVDT
jgi:hypothetical protein